MREKRVKTINQNLEKWAQLLLDVGKKNSLINFRDMKGSTVEFVSPDPDTLFNRLSGDGQWEIFNPKLSERLDEDFNEKEYVEDVDKKREYIRKYTEFLKKNQILPYSAGSPIRAIKAIDKQASSAIEETGVNIAYVAFGFIHWHEKHDKNTKFSAPVLLIPVTIKNENSISPVFISSTDDDVTVNPTFSYKLSHDYNIQLPEYNGESLSEYLTKVSGIVNKLRWSVTNEVKLGIFSFLKINMYRDLEDNALQILQNDNIKRMMGEKVDDEVSEVVEEPTDEVFHNVVDADSSQLEAISFAKKGKSFVLQGPPGTGKSQTITNIIAECLMDGKTVLFVSEKLAALEVVYDKLKKAGLEEFCLQLHSYKASKKDVIEDLEKTLKKAKSGVSSKAESELATLEKTRKMLDEYAEELHKVREGINLSLYELYEKYSSFRDCKDVPFVSPDIKLQGEEFISEAIDLFDKYIQLVPTVGIDYKYNPWYGYVISDMSYSADIATKESFVEVANLVDDLGEISEKIYTVCNIQCNTIASLRQVSELLLLLGTSDFILPFLLNTAMLDYLIKAVTNMQKLSADIIENKKFVDEKFDTDVYKLPANALYKQLNQNFGGGIKRNFSSEYRDIKREFKYCKKGKTKLNYKNMSITAQKVAMVQEAQKNFNSLEVRVKMCLGGVYNGIYTDWEHVLKQLQQLYNCISTLPSFGSLPTLSTERFIVLRKEFFDFGNIALAKLNEKYNAVEYVQNSFHTSVFDMIRTEYSEVKNKLLRCQNEFDKRNSWILFDKLLDAMDAKGIKKFVDLCIERNLKAETYPEVYQKNFYKQWIDNVIHESEILTGFNRTTQDLAVDIFCEKDRLQFEINKAIIKATLSEKRPDLNFVASGSSISVLLREAQKKRKQKPVRALLGEIGELAQVLKPCFMMSPLSVSTFLDSQKISFDTVVFDEASQIFPQDAIGAIYRAKQLIVVGDSKQMPPSNFFNSMTGSEDYDDTEDITDFESVLDLCSTAMPQLRLKWHYRSRFEELISFSNKNFYSDDLVTFPSAQQKTVGLGVDYCHVDGVFDRRTKTNKAEAEFVADLIIKHFAEYPDRSLGVVAFSASQQDLIERCLAKRRAKGEVSEEIYKNSKEPFFVKNLETVQGDERDTIIFSMAYAPDSSGKFLTNFGPINRVGGERRLNVAFTRAKYNIHLVASVHSYDIDVKGTQSAGVRLLQEYLDFAENGIVALARTEEENSFAQSQSDFEEEVYDFLTSKGYSLDRQVGCSKFKVDLALKKPHSSEYLLAIECDGTTYFSAKGTRDRDRLRQQILENMGWKYYRIWSTDWYKNKKSEMEKLLTAVNNALNYISVFPDEEVKMPMGEEEFVEPKPTIKLKFPAYNMLSVEDAKQKTGNDFPAMVKEILLVEGPLSEEWLLKRACRLFDRAKVTSVVVDAYLTKMQNADKYGIIRKDGFLYLEGQRKFILRVPKENTLSREIKYISLEELASGLYEIIRHNVTVKKEGLFKELAQQLGFSRMGDAITARLNDALKLIESKLIIEGEVISFR